MEKSNEKEGKESILFGKFAILYDLACVIFTSFLDYDSFCTTRQVSKNWNKIITAIGENKYQRELESYGIKEGALLNFKRSCEDNYVASMMSISTLYIRPSCANCPNPHYDSYTGMCFELAMDHKLMYTKIPNPAIFLNYKDIWPCICSKWQWNMDAIRLFLNELTKPGTTISFASFEKTLRTLVRKNSSILYMSTRHISRNTYSGYNHVDYTYRNVFLSGNLNISLMWLYMFYDRMNMESKQQ